MAKRYRLNLIQVKESYTPDDIVKLLKVNKKTISRWLDDGLEKNTNPLLIMGLELRDFLRLKQQEKKIKLNNDEFFCMRCQKAVKGKDESVQIIKTGKTMGKNKLEQLNKIGVCEFCESRVNKFMSCQQTY